METTKTAQIKVMRFDGTVLLETPKQTKTIRVTDFLMKFNKILTWVGECNSEKLYTEPLVTYIFVEDEPLDFARLAMEAGNPRPFNFNECSEIFIKSLEL